MRPTGYQSPRYPGLCSASVNEGRARSAGPYRLPIVPLAQDARQGSRALSHRRPRRVLPIPVSASCLLLSRVGTKRVWRSLRWALPTPRSEAGMGRLARLRRTVCPAVRDRHPWEAAGRRYHLAARRLSIMRATASISARSSLSASSLATSAASASSSRCRAAVSTRDNRMAWERVKPVASSWPRACNASSSNRTDNAREDTLSAYHVLSYSTPDPRSDYQAGLATGGAALGGY